MDALKYVNSKDIRKHLEEIDYKFSSVETAWLVWQCKGITLEEKHSAWQEIIETMPDAFIEREKRNLHVLLTAQIAYDNHLIEELFNETDGAVYSYDTDTATDNRILSTFEQCMEGALELSRDFDEEVNQIRIKKQYINKSAGKSIIAKLKPDKTVISVESEYDSFFDYLQLNFPLPFQKGDIVWIPEKPAAPFVWLTYDLAAAYAECYRYHEEIGIYLSEFDMPCMDLEYYPTEKIKDMERVLKILSDYLKGKIHVIRFTNEYHRIVMEESVKSFGRLDKFLPKEPVKGFDMPEFEKAVKWEEISDVEELPF